MVWFFCFLYTHPSGRWLLSKWKLTVKEESKKSAKVIWRLWGRHSSCKACLNPCWNTTYHVLIPKGFLCWYLCEPFFLHPQEGGKKTQISHSYTVWLFHKSWEILTKFLLVLQPLVGRPSTWVKAEGAGMWMQSTALPRRVAHAQWSAVHYLRACFPSGLSWTW